MNTDYDTLQRIAATFDEYNDDGWDTCEITDQIAKLLVRVGHMVECVSHGPHSARYECPQCDKCDGCGQHSDSCECCGNCGCYECECETCDDCGERTDYCECVEMQP